MVILGKFSISLLVLMSKILDQHGILGDKKKKNISIKLDFFLLLLECLIIIIIRIIIFIIIIAHHIKPVVSETGFYLSRSGFKHLKTSLNIETVNLTFIIFVSLSPLVFRISKLWSHNPDWNWDYKIQTPNSLLILRCLEIQHHNWDWCHESVIETFKSHILVEESLLRIILFAKLQLPKTYFEWNVPACCIILHTFKLCSINLNNFG